MARHDARIRPWPPGGKAGGEGDEADERRGGAHLRGIAPETSGARESGKVREIGIVTPAGPGRHRFTSPYEPSRATPATIGVMKSYRFISTAALIIASAFVLTACEDKKDEKPAAAADEKAEDKKEEMKAGDEKADADKGEGDTKEAKADEADEAEDKDDAAEEEGEEKADDAAE